MTSVWTNIFFIIFLVHISLAKKSKQAKQIKNNTENDLAHGVILPFWDPNKSSSLEHRRYSHKKESLLGLIKNANNTDRLSNVTQMKRSTANMNLTGSVNVSVASKDSLRSRFGLHDGVHVRFSRNNERQGPKVLSTRIAPMHLMQQEAQHPRDPRPKDEQQQYRDDVFEGDPFILSPYALEQQISKLLSEFPDVSFTSDVLGRTASYIDIRLFMITQKGGNFFRARENKYVENEAKEKKILFIVHALSPMGLSSFYTLTLEHYLRRLLSYYLEHLDKFDIYFIPLANPDGYEKVKYDNHWNKNYAVNDNCQGVNVDRNFDVAWNTTTYVSSCSQHYPGPAPFSEPESRAVRDVLHHMSHKIVAYFHVHAGTYTMDTFKGDAVLYPKGYTDHQSDDDKYIDLKGEIDEAIKNANFKVLSVAVDTLYSWYGRVTGTSVDYAATVYGIPYAMELVMQLYLDAYQTHFNKMIFKTGNDNIEDLSLEQIWRRVINVTFTHIHKSLEGGDNK